MTERGIFDLRVWVEGEDELEVWRRAVELQRAADLLSGQGVHVRYIQLRPATRTRGDVFVATMPKGKKRR
jgi:hypothetical protein